MADAGIVRVRDRVKCTCFCKKKRCPDGSVKTGSTTVFVNNRGVARKGDISTNCCGSCCKCPNYILSGSARTFVEGQGVARRPDRVSCGYFQQSSTDTFSG